MGQSRQPDKAYYRIQISFYPKLATRDTNVKCKRQGIRPWVDWGVRRALIRIDGRPLLDIVRELEAPIAAANGEPDLAGQYGYLPAAEVLLPSRRLLGMLAHPGLGYGEKVSVLECECGCEGCWPLLMRIAVTDDFVIWRDPEQLHRKHWVYPAHWQLVFDRRQYQQALESAT